MIETIINNIDTVFTIIGYVVSAATAIVKLTPNTKDDSFMEKVVNFFDYFSVVNTKKNQEKLDK
jgi:hypothetical protein